MKKEIEALRKEIKRSKKSDSFSRGFQKVLDQQNKDRIEYEKEIKKKEDRQNKEAKRLRIKKWKTEAKDKQIQLKGDIKELKETVIHLEELNKRLIKELENKKKIKK